MLKIIIIVAVVLVLLWVARRTCTNADIAAILRAFEILTLVVLVGGIVFWVFGNLEQQGAKKVSEKITAFEQGRALVCGNQIISKQTHNLARGTLVFVGNTTQNKGNKIELRDCEITPNQEKEPTQQ